MPNVHPNEKSFQFKKLFEYSSAKYSMGKAILYLKLKLDAFYVFWKIFIKDFNVFLDSPHAFKKQQQLAAHA